MVPPRDSHGALTLSESASDTLSQHSHLDLTDQIEFVDDNIRGCGGFSDVYYGRLAICDKYVAIKRLRVHIQHKIQLSKNIARELGIWASLNHPNVLPLLGYIIPHSTFAFVSEWMENGTVRDFLKKYPDSDRIEIVKGIATGLIYLHDQKVIHSDIKTDNVLISSAGIPMLSDFGVSSVVIASQIISDPTNFKGSARWMAIEFYVQNQGILVKANEKTDVWAFGMTIYEILSGKRPFEHLPTDIQASFAIASGELPSAPEGINWRLWGLCQQCWRRLPAERPPMRDLLKKIVDIPSPWMGHSRSDGQLHNPGPTAGQNCLSQHETAHRPAEETSSTLPPDDVPNDWTVRLPFPVATSIAARIHYADSSLETLPEGCRAILLASAGRNDDGYGYGVVDAETAVKIARKRGTCNGAAMEHGWDAGEMASTDIGTDNLATSRYYVQVPNITGLVVKVALTYTSNVAADAAGTPTSPTLNVGLDLWLRELGSTDLTALTSNWDKSYEVVEFATLPGKTYEVLIRRISGTDPVRYGVAWTVVRLESRPLPAPNRQA